MPNVRYTPEQKAYIRQHYHALSNQEIAQQLGISNPEKVRALAGRMGIKWRAENGAPRWRPKRQGGEAGAWGKGSRWAAM